MKKHLTRLAVAILALFAAVGIAAAGITGLYNVDGTATIPADGVDAGTTNWLTIATIPPNATTEASTNDLALCLAVYVNNAYTGTVTRVKIGELRCRVTDPNKATEDGVWEMYSMVAGANTLVWSSGDGWSGIITNKPTLTNRITVVRGRITNKTQP
jgi:hypothetical protein